MTVFIYTKGSSNLAVLLTQIQPQLDPDSDIYIVDASKNREGLRIAKLYGSTRCYIFVEVGDYNWDKAYGFAYQSMLENKQEGILAISENAIISKTFIGNARRALKMGAYTASPKVLRTPYDQFPNSFKWYNPVVKSLKDGEFSRDCFITNHPLDVQKIGVFPEETIVLLPTPKQGSERTT